MAKIKNPIMIDGWRVYDLPISCSEADYENARKELAAEAKNTQGLVALFQWGYVPYLGISDMDCFAVSADDAAHIYMALEPELSDTSQYVLKHEVLLISERHYKDIMYFDPWTRNIWPDGHYPVYLREGITRDLNFKKYNFSQEDYRVLSLMRAWEFIMLSYPATRWYARKELPVRDVFETLKSFIYIIREINAITDEKIDESFSARLQDLMANWFKLDQAEGVRRLIPLLYEGLQVIYQCLFVISRWSLQYSKMETTERLGIKKTNILHGSRKIKGKTIYIDSPKTRMVFSDQIISPQQALDMTVNSYQNIRIQAGRRKKNIDFDIVYLPIEASAVLLGIASGNGILSKKLRENTYSNMSTVHAFIPKAFQKKVQLINEITETYDAKKLKNMNGKGMIFGNNLFGFPLTGVSWGRRAINWLIKFKFWQIANSLRI